MTMQASFTERVVELENHYWSRRMSGTMLGDADLRALAVKWWGIGLAQADRMARLVVEGATI